MDSFRDSVLVELGNRLLHDSPASAIPMCNCGAEHYVMQAACECMCEPRMDWKCSQCLTPYIKVKYER